MLSANGSAFMHAQDSGARGEVTCFGHSLRPHHLVAALRKPIAPAIFNTADANAEPPLLQPIEAPPIYVCAA
jgi:hypothetical protein